MGSIDKRSWQLIRYWKFWECVKAPGIGDIATQVLYFFIRASNFQASQPQRGRKPAEMWSEAIAWLQQSPLTSSTLVYLEIEMMWISTWAILNNFQQKRISIATAQEAHHTLVGQFRIWESRYEALPRAALLAVPIHAVVLDTQRILLRILLQVKPQTETE